MLAQTQAYAIEHLPTLFRQYSIIAVSTEGAFAFV